jgi:hypothetical protein
MSANDNTNVLLYPPLPPAELKDAHAYNDEAIMMLRRFTTRALLSGALAFLVPAPMPSLNRLRRRSRNTWTRWTR